VHVLIDGKIAESGDYALVEKIESSGYESFA
jgi:Fe-S cluster assembly ATPase SufC